MESSPDQELSTKTKSEKSMKKDQQTDKIGRIDIEKDHSSTEEESENEEDEGCDIEFPRENASELLQFLHRELNNLQNMEDGQKRKFALIRLYQIFVQAKQKAPNKIYQELLPMIQKQLFKRLSDKMEKCRELAGLIIKEFFVRSDDLTLSIPYLMPVLIERLNAEDLEGIEGLPDVMKPPTTQKPQVMIQQIEPSEEVRLVLAEIVTVMVSSTVFDCLRAYIDQLVSILRALCMDPYGGVIIEGCQAMLEFAQNGGDQLLHFAENMARSLFTAFTNKHAKVRIAGLNAFYHVLFCGVWKFNANIMEHIIGFRDPNTIPIKEFYESQTKLNYFAMFVADRSTVVRSHFYRTMANLMLKLPDKKDHEGRVFPYLISGLYDENDDIRETVYELIEEMGKQYEEEYEKDIRELKQLGFQPEWSFEGKVKESDLILPLPFFYRPCLGARILVRSYVRRYLHAIYKEVTDWIQENRERASNLLLSCIIYTEDFMTQYLDHLLVALYKAVQEKENKTVMKNIPLCIKFLGRYCAPRAYGPLVLQALRNELASYYPHTQAGALKAFGYFFAGTVEIFPKNESLEKVSELLAEFITSIQSNVIDSLDMELADGLIDTLSIMVDMMIQKQEKGLDITLWQQYQKDVFQMVIRALGVYNNFKLINKAEPEHNFAYKKKCLHLLNSLKFLSKDPEADFFDSNLVQYFLDEFPTDESIDKCKDWGMPNHKWRMFYVIFDLIEDKQLAYFIDQAATVTIFDRISQVLRAILSNGESKNFNVKNVVLTQIFPNFVNKSLKFHSLNATSHYLQILLQASKIEWQNPEESSRQLLHVVKLQNNLIDCKGILIGDQNIEAFNDFMNGFEGYFKEKKESAKCEIATIIRKLLELYWEQAISGRSQTDKIVALQKLTFLNSLCEQVIKYITDYFDSVREQGQILLKFLAKNFMADEVSFTEDQQDLLQMLRANSQLGWGSNMKQQLKDASEMEADLNKHLFKDPQQYLKSVIAVMMDETHGRDNLIWIIKEFNKKTPFMLLNDYRVAVASNSVRRVEILREVIFK